MIQQHTISEVSKAFAELDLSPQNNLIAAIQAETGRLEHAMEAARARVAEIDAQIVELRHPELQGAAIADALLAEISPAEAAAVNGRYDDLREERDNLRQGLHELGRRIELERRKIKDVEATAFVRVQELAAPLVEALHKEAREAAEKLWSVHASITALNITTKAGIVAGRGIQSALQAAVSGGLSDQQAMSVPDKIQGALSHLEGKGPALKVYQVRTAQLY